jgi:flagellar protein FliS
MYAATGAASHYLGTQVGSSTPLERVVLLYDGASREVTAAREATVARNLVARGKAISRAMAIIDELQRVLDMERGGDLARDLDRLYSWMNERLIDAISTRDVTPLDELRRLLETLSDAWRSISTAPRESTP